MGTSMIGTHAFSYPLRIFTFSLLLIRYILAHPHSDMYLHHNFACREELDRTVTQERSERMETWEHQVHVATLVQQESTYVPVTINSI